MREEHSARLGDQTLLPEILQRRPEDPDHPGAAAGQGAGDRVGLVAEVAGHLADPLLGLLGDLDPAQRVGDGRRRDAGGVGHVPDRDTLDGRAHGRPDRVGLPPGAGVALRLIMSRPSGPVDKPVVNRFT